MSRPSDTLQHPSERAGPWEKVGSPGRHLAALLSVVVTLVIVGAIESVVPGLQTIVLLYVVPITIAATRWGTGPAITAALASVLGHDVLFVEPIGYPTVARADEAVGLMLLLFTALVTSQLSIVARRSAERAREADVARRSDALKTALLRAVSHDLRTPLASIKASVSGLRQSGAAYTEDDRAELLAAIEEEADRLTRLVTDLLDASRLEAGVLAQDRRPQDRAELVDDVVRRLRPVLGDRPLTIDIPEGLPAVAYDYAQIDRVVTNLLENAAAHTPPDAPIEIQARPAWGEVRVSVTDRGPGVPVADRERLFHAFERGRTGARGSGLGLAIARGFAEAHGGRLWVEDGPGGGARFVFTLPTVMPGS